MLWALFSREQVTSYIYLYGYSTDIWLEHRVTEQDLTLHITQTEISKLETLLGNKQMQPMDCFP